MAVAAPNAAVAADDMEDTTGERWEDEEGEVVRAAETVDGSEVRMADTVLLICFCVSFVYFVEDNIVQYEHLRLPAYLFRIPSLLPSLRVRLNALGFPTT